MEIKQFKCRASKIGLLMTNPTGKSNLEKLIEAKEKLASLKERYEKAVNKEAKTFVEIKNVKILELEKEIASLELVKDVKELSETAKSYCKEWLISKFTGKEKEVKSKYLERGHEMEESAIQRVAKHYNCELVKNETQLENDFFTGMYDTINYERVIDTKVPFDCFTFPYFVTVVDSDYYGQLQGYMDLTGLKKASLAYCLENGSHSQIDRLSWQIAKIKDKDEPDIDEWDEADKKLSYDHLPEYLRIKVFEFEFDNEYIEKAKERVLMARKYIKNELLTQIKL